MATTIANLNTTELSEQIAIAMNDKFGKFDFATIASGDGKVWGDTVNVPLVSAGSPTAAGARPSFETDGSNSYSGKPLVINRSAISSTSYFADQRVNEDALVKATIATIAKQIETELFALATTANFTATAQVVAGGDWASTAFKKVINESIKLCPMSRSNLWTVLDGSSAATLAEKHGAAYNYGDSSLVQGGNFAKLFGSNIYEADGTLPTTVTTTAKVGFVTDGTGLGLVFGQENIGNMGSQVEMSEGALNDVKIYVRKHQNSADGKIWLNVYSLYGVGAINPLGLRIITSAS